MKKNFCILLVLLMTYSAYSQWELLPGPGANNYIANLDVDNNAIYISAAANALYKSTDMGMNWIELNNNSDVIFNGIKSLCKVKDLLFIYSASEAIDPTQGIYMSSDEGLNWQKMERGIKWPGDIFRMFYKDNETLYVLFDRSLYKYNDIEKRWEIPYALYPGDSLRVGGAFGGRSMLINNGKFFFGIPAQGDTTKPSKTGDNIKIYSQKDKVWTFVLDTTSNIWKYSITSFAVINNKIFAGTTGGVYVSTDEGLHWVKANNGLSYGDKDYEVHYLLAKNDYLYAIFSGQINGDSYVAYSTDEGENWIIDSSDLNNKYSPRIVKALNEKLIFATREGIFSSLGSVTNLTNLNTRVFNGYVAVDIAANYEKLFAIAINVAYRNTTLWESTDKGNTWTQNHNILNKRFDRIAVKDSFIILGDIYSRSKWYSTDGGKNFQQITTNSVLQDLQTLTIKIFNDTTYLGTNSGIYYSGDWGKTWKELNPSLGGYVIYCIDIPANNSSYKNYIFAGTKDSKVLISTDRGNSWDNSVIAPDLFRIRDIKVTYNAIYVGTADYNGTHEGRGMFVSTNGGKTFREINSGYLHSLGISSIVEKDYSLFISSTYFGGVYCFSGGGPYTMWRQYNYGLTNAEINKLLIRDEYLYAATAGGVFRVKLSDFGIVNVAEEQVERRNYLHTYLPYPQPAMDKVSVTIFWDANLDIGTADIKIYDIYGKEVGDKKDIEVTPESTWYGTLIWDCKGIEPGIYLITINYGTEKELIKIMKI